MQYSAVAPPTAAELRRAKPKQPRFYYYAPHHAEARLRAAYAATAHLTGTTSYNDFRVQAMLAEAERLEAEHNGGRPFDPAPERFRPGRPLGS